MATRRDQLLDGIVAALNTGRPVGVPAATRARTRQLDTAALPAISVYPGPKETVTPIGGRWSGIVERRLEVQVGVWATASEPAPLDRAADACLAWVVKALAGKRELGGVSITLEEIETTWDYQGGAPPIVSASVTFNATYRTAQADPEVAG